MIPRSRNFTFVENRFRAGDLDPTAAFILRRGTAQLLDSLRAYRPDNLTPGRVAVIELLPDEKVPGDPDAHALAKRLRWMFTDVVHLKALPDGRFINAASDAIDLVGHDLVWLHTSGRSPAAQVRYYVSADLARAIPSAHAVAQLRRFIDSGHGMVLSGLATCLVTDLGLESYPPNHRYWGSMLVPGRGLSRHRYPVPPEVKSLGLRRLVADHPLFAGLPADGFATMEFNSAELVTEAVWQRPPGTPEAWRSPVWPQHGRVLAGYWSDRVKLAENYAAVVAYEANSGAKLLLLGGAFDPRVSTNRPRRGAHYDQLIRNVVAWCSGKPRGEGERSR